MSTAIRTVAVCGAGGTMGTGIGLVDARGGFKVVCLDCARADLTI